MLVNYVLNEDGEPFAVGCAGGSAQILGCSDGKYRVLFRDPELRKLHDRKARYSDREEAASAALGVIIWRLSGGGRRPVY